MYDVEGDVLDVYALNVESALQVVVQVQNRKSTVHLSKTHEDLVKLVKDLVKRMERTSENCMNRTMK